MHAWWNQGEVAKVGMGNGGKRETGPNIGQFNTNNPPFPLVLHWEMGVKPKTGNSTLTQKRANVNNQMDDT